MEKVLKQATQRARVADRQLAKRQKILKNGKEWEIRQQRQANAKYEKSLYKQARKAREDQWLRGPLAARHDIGEQAKFHGTFNPQNFSWTKEYDARKPRWWHIMAGDRVVVCTGVDAGKIGEVVNVDKANASVKVRGMNKFEVEVPELVRKDQGGEDIIAIEREISIKDVKLVYALAHPTTGVPRDVVVDSLEPVDRHFDYNKREMTDGQRVVSGTDIVIPWPERAEETEQDYDADTPSGLVDEATFRPHLLAAPMPLNLIDELRNKYSKFRTRHDRAFVEKIDERAAKVERREQLIETMRTPVQRIAARRAELKEKHKKVLTEANMELIGRVMAQESLRTEQQSRL